MDDIYEQFVFVKALSCPNENGMMKYKRTQESARKDVEQTFRALKTVHPTLFYMEDKLAEFMYTCIILHNVILGDERHMMRV